MSPPPLCLTFLCLSLLLAVTWASDPDPLQDYCVGNVESPIRVNGFPCKPEVTNLDFVSRVLREPAVVENRLGSAITEVSAFNFPALNTQGLSIQRFTYSVGGIIPPHVHPRSSELLFVVEGTILAGFITTENRFFYATLERGDLFIFPRGLIHFAVNVGETPAQSLSSFNSQNPGTAIIPNALFFSKPNIPATILARTFALSQGVLETIRIALQTLLV